ncbi:MAG: cell division protein ZapA [Alphaproteobacteria bacterium]|nr:cell division protein ZapA [Alphaproteobacteria bacterium]MCB9931599.1 cell division protein ZapA [Alphaproteobacteria bacterium]
MPDVSFSVGTRRYTLRCAAGQEDHLTDMAAALDSRVQTLSGGAPGAEERQMLVIAAIGLLDELQAVKRGNGADGAALPKRAPDSDAAALRRDLESAQADNRALRETLARAEADNRALRAWADGMAGRLSGLSATLAALASNPDDD